MGTLFVSPVFYSSVRTAKRYVWSNVIRKRYFQPACNQRNRRNLALDDAPREEVQAELLIREQVPDSEKGKNFFGYSKTVFRKNVPSEGSSNLWIISIWSPCVCGSFCPVLHCLPNQLSQEVLLLLITCLSFAIVPIKDIFTFFLKLWHNGIFKVAWLTQHYSDRPETRQVAQRGAES